MNRNDDETLLGDHSHRCLQIFGRHNRGSIGAMDHEEYLTIEGAGLQVHHLACTETKQVLLGGRPAKLSGHLDSGLAYHLAGWQISGSELVEKLCVHYVRALAFAQLEHAILAAASPLSLLGATP